MLFEILGAPITAPIAGIRFVLNQILTLAQREYDSPERLREALLLLQLKLSEGEITEEEFQVQEDDIIRQMREARERVRQQSAIPPAEGP